MSTPQKIDLLYRIITPQEIEWLHRIEKELGFYKGKLVQALIRDRTLMPLDTYDELYRPERFPDKSTQKNKNKKEVPAK